MKYVGIWNMMNGMRKLEYGNERNVKMEYGNMMEYDEICWKT